LWRATCFDERVGGDCGEAAKAEAGGQLAAGISGPGIARVAAWRAIVLRPDMDALRFVAIAAGLAWAIAFPLVGLKYELQTYGDGALFSYAVAAENAWAFHWHNISGRLFVFLAASLPAETYVGLTGDPRGGVALYGFLFFAAPLAGLAATFAADRSARREFFVFACASTACICPLVFGCPTETWIAHAVFWPALAICHGAPCGLAGRLLVPSAMLALVFTHEAAVLFAAIIVASLLPHGWRDVALRRAALAFLAALIAWLAVKLTFRPDPYTAEILMRLALGVFDMSVLGGDLVRLLACTLGGYALGFALLSRLKLARAEDWAFWLVVAVLAAHWLWLDQTLHADNRYYLRTVVIVATPLLGLSAAIRVLRSGRHIPLPRPLSRLSAALPARAMLRMVLIVALVHAVETAKFAAAWTDYRQAIRTLAASDASDPRLGNERFVSSERLDTEESRLEWRSTSPFLSVLVTSDFAPARLVVAPDVNFFWISCETATASLDAAGALPLATRELLRIYSCLHRKGRYAAR